MYYTAVAVVFGLVILYFAWAWIWPNRSKAPIQKPKPKQQMLLQGTALSWIDDELVRLNRAVTDRSLEIAKSDGRFLVTPDDMKQAYQEIIREEHM